MMWFNLTRMLCFGWLYLFYIILLVSCNTESSFRWIEPYVSIVYEVTNKWWRERKTSPWEANSVSNRQPGHFRLIICPAQLLLPPTSQPYLFVISNFLSPSLSPLLSRSPDNSNSSSSAGHRGSLERRQKGKANLRRPAAWVRWQEVRRHEQSWSGGSVWHLVGAPDPSGHSRALEP